MDHEFSTQFGWIFGIFLIFLIFLIFFIILNDHLKKYAKY